MTNKLTQRETFQDRPVYTLSEITKSIESVIGKNYNRAYYIKAEILKLNYYPHSGHCYPELVEKENGKIKAQLRGVIWSTQFRNINERFVTITGESLKEDISILCLATIEFSAQHGLNLHIQDIEPIYTLGEMARNKREVIEKLKKEQLFLQNKQKKLPVVPKKIAIISVETSKGYSDFMITLQQNSWHYRFQTTLFPSILQGDKALISMPHQLAEIAKRHQEFDCVVIVRGGGGDAGMSCYDDYKLAVAVATFPLPVITGIGHSTNETVTDMVAFANKITPTEVAYFLIQQFHNFALQVEECKDKLVKKIQELLQEQDFYFSKISQQLQLTVGKYNHQKEKEIQMLVQRMQNTANQYILKQQNALHQSQTKIELLHPKNILKRGYSITMKNGKPVRNVDEVTEGEIITTKLWCGEIESVVS
ncbi:MAG: exodeoxyribonuclease VII large subunit [Bacteroidetes bacterium]|nr:exodeoxyribonuclease VII large subunit [Bacteroidota bacterium]MCL2302736.1 exodeoxyribonuclease VII large subunit [Lentimicrobiaceae bacterium]